MNNALTRANCSECGECGNHLVACNTGDARYQIVHGGVIVDYAHVENGLADNLMKLQGRNGLQGVTVWLDGKRVSRDELTDIWLNYLNGQTFASRRSNLSV